jgi:hypothetical protein
LTWESFKKTPIILYPTRKPKPKLARSSVKEAGLPTIIFSSSENNNPSSSFLFSSFFRNMAATTNAMATRKPKELIYKVKPGGVMPNTSFKKK